MKLKELETLLKENGYDVSKLTINTSYVLKLGGKGCITAQYVNDEFSKFVVDGKEKEKILKMLAKLLDK